MNGETLYKQQYYGGIQKMGKIIQTAGRNALGEFAPEFAHFNERA